MTTAIPSPRRALILAAALLLPSMLHAQPGIPALALPGENATEVPTTTSFVWRPVAGAVTYEIQLSFDAAFATPAYDNETPGSDIEVADLWPDTLYHWRVRTIDTLDSVGEWSAPRSFRTVTTGAPRPYTPGDGDGDIPVNGTTLGFTAQSTPPNGFDLQYSYDPGFRSGVSLLTTSTTSATLPTLPFDTTVYWRVRVAGGAAAGPGPWSRTVRFTTAEAPLPQLGLCTPIAPVNGFELENVFVTSIWSGPTAGAAPARYHVQFGQDRSMSEVAFDFSDLDSTSLTVRLSPGEWFWRVRALSTTEGMIDGAWSSVATFEVRERPGTALGAPTLFLPPNGSRDRGVGVTLSWDSVAEATEYEMEIGRDTTFETSDTTVTTVRRAAAVGNLQSDTLYIWRVRALADSGRNIGSWSQPFTFTTRDTAVDQLSAPTLLSPVNGRRDLDPTVPLLWSPAPGAIAHQVQVSGDSTFSGDMQTLAAFDSTGTVVLEAGRRWWWRARGMNETGPGPWSPVWTFTTSGSSSVNIRTTAPVYDIAVTPLPARDHASLTASLTMAGEVSVAIITMRGGSVAQLTGTASADGTLRIELPVAALAAGVYRCRITTPAGLSLDTPLVITR